MAARVAASRRFPLSRPNDGGPALVWVPAPGPCEFPCREKTSSIDRKASLTEIEPSRKSAAARKAPIQNLPKRTGSRERDLSCGAELRRYQTNFGRTCYGNDLNSSGGGQRREARLAQLRGGGDARVQMREQSRRG